MPISLRQFCLMKNGRKDCLNHCFSLFRLFGGPGTAQCWLWRIRRLCWFLEKDFVTALTDLLPVHQHQDPRCDQNLRSLLRSFLLLLQTRLRLPFWLVQPLVSSKLWLLRQLLLPVFLSPLLLSSRLVTSLRPLLLFLFLTDWLLLLLLKLPGLQLVQHPYFLLCLRLQFSQPILLFLLVGLLSFSFQHPGLQVSWPRLDQCLPLPPLEAVNFLLLERQLTLLVILPAISLSPEFPANGRKLFPST